MTIARLENLTYWYPNAARPALSEVNLEIEAGAFGLLAGESAGGKSTLLRVFNGLVPQFHGGRLTGSALVAGLDPARAPARQMALSAGMVFQDPEAQTVAETVEEEIAFGMEQQAVPREEMRTRMVHALETLAIEHLRHRRINTLSGGERQRVAISAVLALEPSLLLLDEPTSQLDRAGSDALISALERLHARGNMTILVAEHRLDRLLSVVDHVLGVAAGAVRQMTPVQAAAELDAVPPACELGRRLGMAPVPLTVAEARRSMPTLMALPAVVSSLGDVLLQARGVTVAYGEHVALRDASFSLREGEIVALMGANGSGKSTLFRALTGLEKPASGAVSFPLSKLRPGAPVREVTGYTGLVPQDPSIALYHETVLAELEETLTNRAPRKPRCEVLSAAASAWGIDHLINQNPRDISVGQQQRVAIAAMLAHEPKVWLLDEPTRGADGPAKAWLANRLRTHAAEGGASIVATHDLESAARFATRVIGLKEGLVQFDLPARIAFAADGPYPTQIARLVPGAVTVDEVARG